MQTAITINPEDNVAVALTDLKKGESVRVNQNDVVLKDSVRAKHKFALTDFEEGHEMFMYGLIVGTANQTIQAGGAITTDNTRHKATTFTDKRVGSYQWSSPDISRFKNRTFMGYHREDGQVGTANNWLVFPLVFCQNRNIETIKNAFHKALGYESYDPYIDLAQQLVEGKNPERLKINKDENRDKNRVFKNVDVKFITHQAGCGGTREDSAVFCQLMAGYLNNPNVAGATILSLGCQNAEIKILEAAIKEMNQDFKKPIIILDQQQTGSETDLLESAIKETYKGLVEANKIERKPASLDKLTIGLECGGSDGFSGISANPTLGHVSDMIAGLGGKAILAEFPELCGVEQVLINRMQNEEDANKFSKLMVAYANAAEAVGSGFDMNPSPGNIKDGLITDAMKSAGAAKKGGSSPIVDVLDYAEYAKKEGLNLLCTPGNDVESTTGLAGSGANIILFTTGLGTPTGNPITPVLKLSSNTKTAERMKDIIDFNTGEVIEGKKTIPEMGEELLELIIKIASGETLSKSDILKQFDFIPWKRGVSL